MARIRSIKPEFPQSETIGRLSRDARLLFVLLWTHVDDEGRARAASRMLASLLFPYDDDAPHLIEAWLDDLEAEGCIRRYRVNGTTYLDIPNWAKHQKIDRPSKSRFPAFDEGSSLPRECSRALDADLGPRIRDLGSEDLSSSPEGSEETRAGRAPSDWPTDFREQFWDLFPNKVGKAAAIAKLEAIRKRRDVPWLRLMDGLRLYLAKTDDRPWCNPLTWLNQGRWDDAPADQRARGSPSQASFDSIDPDAIVARLKARHAQSETVQ